MVAKLFTVFIIALMVSACDYSAVRDETSEFYAIPVGSILVLNSEITIPSDQVSVLMQNGVIQHYANIDFYYPNCKFELYTISENARMVSPGRFLITRVVDENEFTSLQSTTYASRGMMISDAPETMTYATVLYLSSEVQPDVYRMTCKHWESVVDDRFLTISQMRKAMGELFSLRMAH